MEKIIDKLVLIRNTLLVLFFFFPVLIFGMAVSMIQLGTDFNKHDPIKRVKK